jgi:hypothetical protein
MPLAEAYCLSLPSDAEFLDDASVAVDVLLLQVIEKAPPLTDDLQQAAAAVMIFLVNLEMLGQIGEPLGKNRYLDFWGTGIGIVKLVALDDTFFLVSGQHVMHTSFLYLLCV